MKMVTNLNSPNQAAPVNAPMALLFQVWQSCRRVTEQRR